MGGKDRNIRVVLVSGSLNRAARVRQLSCIGSIGKKGRSSFFPFN
jgi:hypothetical protein